MAFVTLPARVSAGLLVNSFVLVFFFLGNNKISYNAHTSELIHHAKA